MDIYFDESRNTGEIGFDGSKLNYYEQRYFVLVGYVENPLITYSYNLFKSNWISRIKSNNPNDFEIKGSDLLRVDNTEIRNAFIKEFCQGDNLYISVYDKKYFLVTQLINWLFYKSIDCFGKARDYYYTYCEFLIKLDDLVLGKYVNVTKRNDYVGVVEFVNHLIHHSYSECINSPAEVLIALQWKTDLSGLLKSSPGYIQDLVNRNVKGDRIKNRNRNNIVNLSCLGETILLFKKNTPNLTNQSIRIFHDEIELVQEYILANWGYNNLSFISSKGSLGVQLADNVASIVGKMFYELLPLSSDNTLNKIMSSKYDWVKTTLSMIFNRVNQHNTKIVVSMREMAFFKSVISGKTFENLSQFKKDILLRLDSRYRTEQANHMDQDKAIELLDK